MSIKRRMRKAYFHMLRLLFYSKDSIHKLSLGAAFGLFWGLTPTVGLQMSILTIAYSLVFFLKRIHKKFGVLEFHFPLAIVFTWISNPLDAPFLYFLFYAIGVWVTPGVSMMGFSDFFEELEPLINVKNVYTIDAAKEYAGTVAEVFGSIGYNVLLPMCYGSLVLAIPVSIASYFIIYSLISKKRKKSQERRQKREADVLPTES